jgi:cytochrome b561
MHVLWGWCTIHAVIYLGLLFLALWIAQLVWQWLTERPAPKPRPRPSPQRVPHWARTGHLPPSSSRPQGRHRKHTGSTR